MDPNTILWWLYYDTLLNAPHAPGNGPVAAPDVPLAVAVGALVFFCIVVGMLVVQRHREVRRQRAEATRWAKHWRKIRGFE
jgi:hypothetical protein